MSLQMKLAGNVKQRVSKPSLPVIAQEEKLD